MECIWEIKQLVEDHNPSIITFYTEEAKNDKQRKGTYQWYEWGKKSIAVRFLPACWELV
jgi:hypothetical protein